MADAKPEEKKGPPAAPAGAPGTPAEKGQSGGESKARQVTVDQGFIDRLVKERDESRSALLAMRERADQLEAEFQEIKRTAAAAGAPASPAEEGSAGFWGDEPRIKGLDEKISRVESRITAREAAEAEREVQSRYEKSRVLKSIWPSYKELELEMNAIARSYNVPTGKLMPADARRAIFDKLYASHQEELEAKAIELAKTAPQEDIVVGGLPSGRGPATPASEEIPKLTPAQKELAAIWEIPEEKFAARLADKSRLTLAPDLRR